MKLELKPAFLDSITGLFRGYSLHGGPKTDTGPLIIEDTAAWRKTRKTQTSSLSAARSQAGSREAEED